MEYGLQSNKSQKFQAKSQSISKDIELYTDNIEKFQTYFKQLINNQNIIINQFQDDEKLQVSYALQITQIIIDELKLFLNLNLKSNYLNNKFIDKNFQNSDLNINLLVEYLENFKIEYDSPLDLYQYNYNFKDNPIEQESSININLESQGLYNQTENKDNQNVKKISHKKDPSSSNINKRKIYSKGTSNITVESDKKEDNESQGKSSTTKNINYSSKLQEFFKNQMKHALSLNQMQESTKSMKSQDRSYKVSPESYKNKQRKNIFGQMNRSKQNKDQVELNIAKFQTADPKLRQYSKNINKAPSILSENTSIQSPQKQGQQEFHISEEAKQITTDFINNNYIKGLIKLTNEYYLDEKIPEENLSILSLNNQYMIVNSKTDIHIIDKYNYKVLTKIQSKQPFLYATFTSQRLFLLFQNFEIKVFQQNQQNQLVLVNEGITLQDQIIQQRVYNKVFRNNKIRDSYNNSENQLKDPLQFYSIQKFDKNTLMIGGDYGIIIVFSSQDIFSKQQQFVLNDGSKILQIKRLRDNLDEICVQTSKSIRFCTITDKENNYEFYENKENININNNQLGDFIEYDTNKFIVTIYQQYDIYLMKRNPMKHQIQILKTFEYISQSDLPLQLFLIPNFNIEFLPYILLRTIDSILFIDIKNEKTYQILHFKNYLEMLNDEEYEKYLNQEPNQNQIGNNKIMNINDFNGSLEVNVIEYNKIVEQEDQYYQQILKYSFQNLFYEILAYLSQLVDDQT